MLGEAGVSLLQLSFVKPARLLEITHSTVTTTLRFCINTSSYQQKGQSSGTHISFLYHTVKQHRLKGMGLSSPDSEVLYPASQSMQFLLPFF